MSDDTEDFIVGDRIWINGIKPGYIQYIGETKFASGEWAGVVLDDFSGKNDGSVNGVRYFQCEPKRGIFARLHRLSRYPITADGKINSSLNDGSSKRVSISSDGRYKAVPTRFTSTKTPSYALPARPSKVVTVTTTTIDGANTPIRVGERVIVNSSRGMQPGRVRYYG